MTSASVTIIPFWLISVNGPPMGSATPLKGLLRHFENLSTFSGQNSKLISQRPAIIKVGVAYFKIGLSTEYPLGC